MTLILIWQLLIFYGNFHAENILNENSLYYNEFYANLTHIPLYEMWEDQNENRKLYS